MTTLAYRKGVITRQKNSLSVLVQDSMHLKTNLIFPQGDQLHPFITDQLTAHWHAAVQLETLMGKLESAIEKFADCVDSVEMSEEDMETCGTVISAGNDVVQSALTLHLFITGNINVLQNKKSEKSSTAAVQEPITVKVEVPDYGNIQSILPTFTGKVWEWDNFWHIFNENVHQKNFSDLKKFSYLSAALKGEAASSISRFNVTTENYVTAIDFLTKKYGDQERLITNLYQRLTTTKPHSSSTKDQRTALDQIYAITNQLAKKNEHMDSTLVLNSVLAKFSERYQERTLSKKIDITEPWTMKLLLATMEKLISKDELISTLVSSESHPQKKHEKQDVKKPAKYEDKKKPFGCVYCNDPNHRADDCTLLRTPKERADFLRKSGRCINCTSTKHQLKDCKASGCRKCSKKHHTSTCFGNSNPLSSSTTTEPKRSTTFSSPQKAGKKEHTHGKKTTAESTRQHFTADDNDTDHIPSTEGVVLHLHREQQQMVPRSKVIILTGEAQMQNPNTGELIAVQILLDTGSELSFVNSSFAESMDLPVIGQRTINVHTFGSTHPTRHTCDVVTSQICDPTGRFYDFTLLKHNILTSSLPQAELSEDDWSFITEHNVVLSRNEACTLLKPQILLGCDYLWSLLNTGQTHMELPSGLLLIPSHIGYLITGKQLGSDDDSTYINTIYQSVSTEQETKQWDNFLSLDSTGVEEFSGTKTDEREKINKEVMETFRRTILLKDDGYHVRLPWKEDHDPLPDNKSIAYRRLESVIRTYHNSPEILAMYDQNFQDQLDKDIIEEVDESQPVEGVIHFLAHSAVITPHKETTKMRVVFDASAHFKNSPCLNDVLEQGPLILPEMVGMLLRFRLCNIAMISDVEKAFLQVRLQEIDRDATRFFWLRDYKAPISPDNIVVYRYTRVTFGLNTSPFLLAATIRYHLDTVVDESLRIHAAEITSNLYVDNLLQGSDNPDEAIVKYKASKHLFNDMKMNLREFVSSSQEVNETMEEKNRSSNTCPKVLGITWNSIEDTMLLQCKVPTVHVITKRTVSRQIASIYDPLGLWVPLLLPAKLFLQDLWTKGYDWDAPLPVEMQSTWMHLMHEIGSFTKSLPRKVCSKGQRHTLVTFSDASEVAMGVCCYLVGPDGSHLIMAKSKLPSAKVKMTMPKLEMSALAMVTRMTKYIMDQIGDSVSISDIFIFSDSQIVLSWIKQIPEKSDAGILVRNRVKEIRSLVNSMKPEVQFGYVNTKENPADIASRGVDFRKTTPEQFTTHMWWTGSEFLTQPSQTWNHNDLFALPDPTGEDMVETAYVMSMITNILENAQSEELVNLQRFSTLTKAKRVMAYVLRFIKNTSRNLKTKENCSTGLVANLHREDTPDNSNTLSVLEMETALTIIIRQHQETTDMKPRKSTKDLNLQTDENGLWRCEGRMARSELHRNAQSPIFIAPKSTLARLIIELKHSAMHPGIAATIAAVRSEYWIPQLRQQVRSIITKCIPCQRFNNLPYGYPNMTSLPSQRVCRSRPFEHVGLDYFGPLKIRKEDGQLGEVYGCIFTCMTTRLVHLEVAQNLSTEAFLNAVRRFYSRRGVPSSVTSDNAPTFVLGEAILYDLAQRIRENEEIGTLMANKAIEWRFITPYAPWQGGFYERLIKSIKHALYKSIGRRTLTQDQLLTILIEVEAAINSRPLTYQEAEWDSQPMLRPIDFIQKDIVVQFPMENIDLDQEDPNYQTNREILQFQTRHQVEAALKSSHEIVEQFWIIWHEQYLTSLREYHKLHMNDKRGSTKAPEVGSVVLLLDSNIPRNQWRLARISKLKPNAEGVLREVEVVTSNKRTLRRPVNLLIPLEVEGSKPTSTIEEERESEDKAIPERYNLRRGPRINYAENQEEQNHSELHARPSRTLPIKNVLFLMTLICLTTFASGAPILNTFGLASASAKLSCTPGGVKMITENLELLEVCTEQFCEQWEHPAATMEINFPPEIVLHSHIVKWKMYNGQEITSAETECPPSSFCSSVRCILCTSLILNPECWPMGAILGLALFVYIMVTVCYVFLYVPFVIGRPARAGCTIGFKIISCTVSFGLHLARKLWMGIRTQRNTSRFKRALQGGVALLALTEACQKINVFSHTSTICTHSRNNNRKCRIEATEVFKINPFQQEACIKIVSNTSTLTEIRLRWKKLVLRCEPESLLFTRHTEYKVIDSKRCAHTGSCRQSKCEAINSTTLLPELQIGNSHPGSTYCSSSCGGPGCDCFYLSSGCLFYRIYLTPCSEAIYGIFKCTRWEEVVEIELSRFSQENRHPEVTLLQLRPNIPQEVGAMTLTLSTLTVPPLPLLNTHFISDGTNTALWKASKTPPLQCSSELSAKEMQCDVDDDCICTPAENSVKCRCHELNITARFNNVQNRLPLSLPSVTFRQENNGSVLAEIPSMATAEVILNLHEDLTVESEVSEDWCSIEDATIHGCYKCRKRAFSSVTCTSTQAHTIAEVECTSASFTIPCTQTGVTTQLLFNLDKARIRLECTVRCGSRKKNFGLSGILKYSTSLEMSYRRMQNGESNVVQEIAWPDLGHIIDVYLQWYKTVIMAVFGTFVALLITYLILSTCGFTFLCGTVKLLFKMFLAPVRIFLSILCMMKTRPASRGKSEEKLL